MPAVDGSNLLGLACDRTSHGRSELAESLADRFNSDGASLSDRERALMFEILHKVIVDMEMAVRRTLSERLADCDDVPRELVSFLANDEVEVAYPVLTRSAVLLDDDLIEVVRNRSLEHQLAVANRFAVGEDVSTALVETGETSVIETLLRNPNARLSETTLSYLVEQSQRVDSFQEPLLGRRELGVDLAKRMFLWVTAALREHIIERFDLDEVTVEELLEQAALTHIDSGAGEQHPSGSEQLADTLAQLDMITPELMTKTLIQGEVGLFVAIFAHKTGLRRNVAMRLLFETGGEGLAVVCKAIGLDRELFSTLFTRVRQARPRSQQALGRDLAAALRLFDETPEDAARRVLARWRRHPDFLAAIRDLEKRPAGHARIVA